MDEGKAKQIYEVLTDLSIEWKGQNFVPKKAVSLFIDIFPAMQSSCDFYKEEEAIEIMDCADRMIDLNRAYLREKSKPLNDNQII